MDRTEALETLRANADAIRGFGVSGLYLFGSTSRGEAAPESDVDLFIDYDKSSGFSLIEFIQLRDYLSSILHAKADLMTRGSIHPIIRDDVIASAQRVF